MCVSHTTGFRVGHLDTPVPTEARVHEGPKLAILSPNNVVLSASPQSKHKESKYPNTEVTGPKSTTAFLTLYHGIWVLGPSGKLTEGLGFGAYGSGLAKWALAPKVWVLMTIDVLQAFMPFVRRVTCLAIRADCLWRGNRWAWKSPDCGCLDAKKHMDHDNTDLNSFNSSVPPACCCCYCCCYCYCCYSHY